MRSLHRIDEDDYDDEPQSKPDDGKPRLKEGVDPSSAPQLKEDDRPDRKSQDKADGDDKADGSDNSDSGDGSAGAKQDNK